MSITVNGNMLRLQLVWFACQSGFGNFPDRTRMWSVTARQGEVKVIVFTKRSLSPKSSFSRFMCSEYRCLKLSAPASTGKCFLTVLTLHAVMVHIISLTHIRIREQIQSGFRFWTRPWHCCKNRFFLSTVKMLIPRRGTGEQLIIWTACSENEPFQALWL